MNNHHNISYKTITYDSLGRQTSLHDPNAGKIEFGHDALDRIIWQRSARGDTTFSEFDSLGRLKRVTEGDRVTTRTYFDSGPNVGQLQAITVDGGTYSTAQIFEYDRFGRLIRFKDVLGTDTLVTRYSYDHFGNLATYTFPSGYRLSYSHTEYGFKYKISDDTHVIWQLDSVNALGQELGSRVLATNQGLFAALPPGLPELEIIDDPIVTRPIGQCPILEFFQNYKVRRQNIRTLQLACLQKREEFSLFFVSLRFGNGVKYENLKP